MPRHRARINFSYTAISNHFIEFQIRNMTIVEARLYLALARLTWGHGKPKDSIAITQLVKITGLSRATIGRNLTRLRRKGFLLSTGIPKRPQIYELQIPKKSEIGRLSIVSLPKQSVGSP